MPNLILNSYSKQNKIIEVRGQFSWDSPLTLSKPISDRPVQTWGGDPGAESPILIILLLY